jgi:hypothetical protein
MYTIKQNTGVIISEDITTWSGGPWSGGDILFSLFYFLSSAAASEKDVLPHRPTE